MFGFSFTEILLILAVALVVLGPEKIPDVARMLGKAIREVRKASNMMRDALMIDDGSSTPRPRPAVPKTPSEAQVAKSAETWTPDPTPKRDVVLKRCSARKVTSDITTVELSPAKDVEHMREVYLHIPYIETI